MNKNLSLLSFQLCIKWALLWFLCWELILDLLSILICSAIRNLTFVNKVFWNTLDFRLERMLMVEPCLFMLFCFYFIGFSCLKHLLNSEHWVQRRLLLIWILVKTRAVKVYYWIWLLLHYHIPFFLNNCAGIFISLWMVRMFSCLIFLHKLLFLFVPFLFMRKFSLFKSLI